MLNVIYSNAIFSFQFVIFLILACFSYGLADDGIESLSQTIGLVAEEDLELRSMVDELIDESNADLDAEDLSDEDVSTLESLEGDSIEEDIEIDEEEVSPLEKIFGQEFTREDIQTIEPVSEESDDEGVHFFTIYRS